MLFRSVTPVSKPAKKTKAASRSKPPAPKPRSTQSQQPHKNAQLNLNEAVERLSKLCEWSVPLYSSTCEWGWMVGTDHDYPHGADDGRVIFNPGEKISHEQVAAARHLVIRSDVQVDPEILNPDLRALVCGYKTNDKWLKAVIARCPRLQCLETNGTVGNKGLACLADLPDLVALEITHRSVNFKPVLPALPALQQLIMRLERNLPLDSIVAATPALQAFGIWESQAAHLHGIEGWTELRRLDLCSCGSLRQLDELAGLHHLRDLRLSYVGGNRAYESLFLENLRELEVIGLNEVKVRNLERLLALPALRAIACHGGVKRSAKHGVVINPDGWIGPEDCRPGWLDSP